VEAAAILEVAGILEVVVLIVEVAAISAVVGVLVEVMIRAEVIFSKKGTPAIKQISSIMQDEPSFAWLILHNAFLGSEVICPLPLPQLTQKYHPRPLPSKVAQQLLPSLLALAGLSDLIPYQPLTLPGSVDLTVTDLALTALSVLGEHGPSGLLLKDVRQHFKDHPEHLRLLAYISVDANKPLTPTVPPVDGELFQRYEALWTEGTSALEQHSAGAVPTEAAIALWQRLHQELLDTAQEVRYPMWLYLRELLKASAQQPELPWRQTWQNYLQHQLRSGHIPYVLYQAFIMLWISLFEKTEEQQVAIWTVLEHLIDPTSHSYRSAQRLIATISSDLRYSRDLRYWRDMRDMRDMRYWRDMRYSRYSRNSRYSRDFILTASLTKVMLARLPVAKLAEAIDISVILLGRLLQIQENGENEPDCADEIRRIAQTGRELLRTAHEEELSQTLLDLFRYLPARTTSEIAFVREQAEQASEPALISACAHTIRYASGRTPEVHQAIARIVQQTRLAELREAAQQWLKARR
jgi:hypothetical protein